ncbi:calcium-binding protein [Amaricoccus sp. W119]|uniref:calcium-binding protein n=1 Tax=Amaricoccus sp. W119 TaxID=3391833 RepID=UPI0039A6545D
MARQASDENDHIRVDAPDTELDARRGTDTVFVTASGAVINGGLGDDWLTTTIDFVREPMEDEDGEEREDAVRELTTELRGDAGDDHLHASIRGRHDDFGDALNLTAKLDGGDGEDVLWIDLAGSGGLAEAFVDAGTGNDIVRVNTMTVDGYFGVSGPTTVEGGDGDDDISIFADGGGPDLPGAYNHAIVNGGAGNDRIETYLDAYSIDAGATLNELDGGDGDDVIRAVAEAGSTFGESQNDVRGGAGDDDIEVTAIIRAYLDGKGQNEVRGDEGDDRIVAAVEVGREPGDGFDALIGENRLSGGDGEDTLSARIDLMGDRAQGTNELIGGAGGDRLTARLTLSPEGEGDEHTGIIGVNLLQGGDGDDELTAIIRADGVAEDAALHSELAGGEGADRLSVQGGDGNILEGNQDDDTLLGGSGDDRLVGGVGDDLLRGRGGDDTFVFGSIRGGERDRVLGFAIGEDLIDISRVDAKSWRSGNQSFTFDDSGEGGSGRVWVEEDPDGHGSLVHADNGRSVLVVSLLDGRSVDAGDYSAGDFLL